MTAHQQWWTLTLVIALCGTAASGQTPSSKNNADLLQQLQATHGLSPEQMTEVRAIFAKSPVIGQGNPAVARHPVTPEQCQAKLQSEKVNYDNPRFQRVCGKPYMAPLYDPAKQPPEAATACIDQFEF